MKQAAATLGQSLLAQPMSAYVICNQQSGVFIDGIRILAPCLHRPQGKHGQILDPDTGEITYGATAIQQSLEEGHGKVYIHSKQIDRRLGAARAILIDCCPPKVLQGHNVFGHAVLQDYVYEILDRVTFMLGIEVQPEDRAKWRAGIVDITEIHLTANFSCPRELVVPIIDAIDLSNRHGKQRLLPSWITLGLTPKRRSMYHCLTIYDKLEEMGVKPQPPNIFHHRMWVEASNGLRVEVKLYSKGLTTRYLRSVANWAAVDVQALFFMVFDSYKIAYAVQTVPTIAQLGALKQKEALAFTNWLLGRSVKDQFPNRGTRANYVRVTKEKLGVDISVDKRAEVQPAVSLKEVFVPVNIRPVPRWAMGTKYYVPPRSRAEGCDSGNSEE